VFDVGGDAALKVPATPGVFLAARAIRLPSRRGCIRACQSSRLRGRCGWFRQESKGRAMHDLRRKPF